MMIAQLIGIFVFGLLITGVVFIGISRAREVDERATRVRQFDAARGREESQRLLRVVGQ